MIIFPQRKVFKIPLYISRKFDIMIKLFGIVPIGAAKIGPVAQLGAHAGQLYAPSFGPVAHMAPIRFASLRLKLHIVICLVR